MQHAMIRQKWFHNRWSDCPIADDSQCRQKDLHREKQCWNSLCDWSWERYFTYPDAPEFCLNVERHTATIKEVGTRPSPHAFVSAHVILCSIATSSPRFLSILCVSLVWLIPSWLMSQQSWNAVPCVNCFKQLTMRTHTICPSADMLFFWTDSNKFWDPADFSKSISVLKGAGKNCFQSMCVYKSSLWQCSTKSFGSGRKSIAWDWQLRRCGASVVASSGSCRSHCKLRGFADCGTKIKVDVSTSTSWTFLKSPARSKLSKTTSVAGWMRQWMRPALLKFVPDFACENCIPATVM